MELDNPKKKEYIIAVRAPETETNNMLRPQGPIQRWPRGSNLAVTGLLPCNAPMALKTALAPSEQARRTRDTWGTNTTRVIIPDMATPLKNLTPRHEYALRLIALGMTVRDAADVIGMSEQRMSWIYHSEQGRAFVLALYAAANDYTARMLALGLTPRHISAAPGGGKHPSKVKPPRRPRKPRGAGDVE